MLPGVDLALMFEREHRHDVAPVVPYRRAVQSRTRNARAVSEGDAAAGCMAIPSSPSEQMVGALRSVARNPIHITRCGAEADHIVFGDQCVAAGGHVLSEGNAASFARSACFRRQCREFLCARRRATEDAFDSLRRYEQVRRKDVDNSFFKSSTLRPVFLGDPREDSGNVRGGRRQMMSEFVKDPEVDSTVACASNDLDLPVFRKVQAGYRASRPRLVLDDLDREIGPQPWNLVARIVSERVAVRLRNEPDKRARQTSILSC